MSNGTNLTALLQNIAVAEVLDTRAQMTLDNESTYQAAQEAVRQAEAVLAAARSKLEANPVYQYRQQAKARLETLTKEYKDTLTAYHREKGAKPFQGSGLTVIQDGSVTILDEDAARTWLIANMPVCLKVDMAAVKRFASGLKGLELPWLKVENSYRVSLPSLEVYRPVIILDPDTGEKIEAK